MRQGVGLLGGTWGHEWCVSVDLMFLPLFIAFCIARDCMPAACEVYMADLWI